MTTTMNTASPARRAFLTLLTSAVVAPAAPAAANPPIEPIDAEAPELIELDRQFLGLAERFKAAKRRRAEVLATFEQLRPSLPEELIVSSHSPYWRLAEEERGPDGAVNRTKVPRLILSSRLVRARILLDDISRHTKKGKEMRRLARLAQAYERGFEAACRTSNCTGAISVLNGLVVDLDQAAWPAVEVPPRTMAGALTIARVAVLRSDIEREIGHTVDAPGLADLAVAAFVRSSWEAQVNCTT
jgi:hypothetical protein